MNTFLDTAIDRAPHATADALLYSKHDARNQQAAAPTGKPVATLTKKSLHFRSSVRVILVPNRSQYTPEERRACWYDDDETERTITSDTVETILAWRRGLLRRDDGGVRSTRGLEHMLSSEALARRQSSKNAVMDAVLDEQFRQRRSDRDIGGAHGENDEPPEDALRRASARASASSVARALERAAMDSAFVRREESARARRRRALAARSPREASMNTPGAKKFQAARPGAIADNRKEAWGGPVQDPRTASQKRLQSHAPWRMTLRESLML